MVDFEFAQAWLRACEIVLESGDAEYSDKETVVESLMAFIANGVIPIYSEGEDEKEDDE